MSQFTGPNYYCPETMELAIRTCLGETGIVLCPYEVGVDRLIRGIPATTVYLTIYAETATIAQWSYDLDYVVETRDFRYSDPNLIADMVAYARSLYDVELPEREKVNRALWWDKHVQERTLSKPGGVSCD